METGELKAKTNRMLNSTWLVFTSLLLITLGLGLTTCGCQAEPPWKYVTLRQAPIAPDAFDCYGEDLLAHFDVLPTWKYATPHNIQRNTPHTASYDACHGSLGFFLTEDNLVRYEVKANRRLILSQPPPPIGTGD